MKFRRARVQTASSEPIELASGEGVSDFDWREIVCADEHGARVEAVRQQQLEDPEEVEWIYLRNQNQQWVARRTPRHMPEPPKSRRSKLLDVVRENLHPENLFGP